MSTGALQDLNWLRASYDRYTETTVSDGTLLDGSDPPVAIANDVEAARAVETLSVYRDVKKRETYSLWLQEWEENPLSQMSVGIWVEYKIPLSDGDLLAALRKYHAFTVTRMSIQDDEDGPLATVTFDAEKRGAWAARAPEDEFAERSLTSFDGNPWKRSSYDSYTESQVSDGTLINYAGTAIADGTEAYRSVATLSVFAKILKHETYQSWFKEWETAALNSFTVKIATTYKDEDIPGDDIDQDYHDYTVTRVTATDDKSGPMSTVRFEAQRVGNWYTRASLEYVEI